MEKTFNEIIRFLGSHSVKDTISFITIVVLSLTAFETFRSRRSSNQANELQLLPVLTVYFQGNISNTKFYIQNIGGGAAFDIQIEDYKLILTDVQEIYTLKLTMSKSNLLGKDEKQEIIAKTYFDRHETSLNNFMLSAIRSNNSKIHIRFKNALRKQYITVAQLSHGFIKILVPPRRTNIIDNLPNLKDFFDVIYWRVIWIFKKPEIRISK